MNLEELIFYVYVYLDPRKAGIYQYGEYCFDYEPFYVGKGCNGRDRVHLYESTYKNRGFGNKIKKIQRVTDNNPIIIRQADRLLNKDACSLEPNMIKTIGRKDLGTGPLLNLKDEEAGSSNISEESRQRMRKPKSEEHRNSMKKAWIERRKRGFSEKHRVSLSKANKGRVPWNKGKTGIYSSMSLEKMRTNHLGEKNPNYGRTGEKHPMFGKTPWNKGMKKNCEGKWIQSTSS